MRNSIIPAYISWLYDHKKTETKEQQYLLDLLISELERANTLWEVQSLFINYIKEFQQTLMHSQEHTLTSKLAHWQQELTKSLQAAGKAKKALPNEGNSLVNLLEVILGNPETILHTHAKNLIRASKHLKAFMVYLEQLPNVSYIPPPNIIPLNIEHQECLQLFCNNHYSLHQRDPLHKKIHLFLQDLLLIYQDIHEQECSHEWEKDNDNPSL